MARTVSGAEKWSISVWPVSGATNVPNLAAWGNSSAVLFSVAAQVAGPSPQKMPSLSPVATNTDPLYSSATTAVRPGDSASMFALLASDSRNTQEAETESGQSRYQWPWQPRE